MEPNFRDKLSQADTLPDPSSNRTFDATEGDAARNFVLSLALEAYEKEMGCARLCALAAPTLRTRETASAVDRRRRAALRRAEAVRHMGDLLGQDLRDDDGRNLRQATAHHRIVCLAASLKMATESRDAELAESVSLECVVQARTMARMTWGKLVAAAKVLHMAEALAASER